MGIGVAAGGLDPLRAFFEHLPADPGMAFVLVQGSDPQRESVLREPLARLTELPVVQIEDDMPVTADTVYVPPPGATPTLRKGVLRLRVRGRSRERRAPIDTFFRSLAEDRGADAIGIILSGAGSDGTLGVRAIKEHDGIAFAQEGEIAGYDDLPDAVAPHLVDQVLAAAEMPAALIGYLEHRTFLDRAKGMDSLHEEAADQLGTVCSVLKTRTGHDFRDYKESTLVRRIQRRMQFLRLDEVADYVERLRDDAEEAQALFRDLLIGVTHFFRDAEAYAALRSHVLSKLVRREPSQDVIRIWVPGCATGEEAYSIALLLRDQLDQLTAPRRVQIFATDIDEDALRYARRAVYPRSIGAAVPEDLLKRFFRLQNTSYQLLEEIRESCIFSTQSLTKDPPFSELDLISCRNVLIYLKPEAQRRLIPLFHYALKPEGCLFLGPAESVSAHQDLFYVLDKKWRIFQRRNNVARPALAFSQQALPLHRHAPQARARSDPDRDVAAAAERAVLENHAPAYVVVDGDREIVHASARTGQYLELSPGAPSFGLLNLARPELRMELRTALHEAARSNAIAVRENVPVTLGKERHLVRLAAQRLTGVGTDERYLVVFESRGLLPDDAGGRDRPGTGGAEAPKGESLEAELKATKEYLRTLTEELESSNEELKSSSEELMSMNEELQSANQELETSKEELQSVNEELETVNAELSSKVDQLASANSDLQNLLESTQIASLFLDQRFRVRKLTPAAKEIFQFVDGDPGRAIADITLRLDGADARADAEAVLKDLTPIEREVRVRGGEATYLMRVFPYRTVANQIDGVVMTLVDVTRQKQAQTEIEQLNRQIQARLDELEALLDLVPVGIAIADDPTCETIRLNRRAAQILREGPTKRPFGAPGASSRLLRDGKPVPVRDLPLQAAIRTGKAVDDFEGTLEFHDGSTVQILLSAAPLYANDGTVRGAIAALDDVSSAKRAQIEAEIRASQQAAIATLGREGLSGTSSADLMQSATEMLRHVLHVDYAKVLRLEPGGDRLTLVAASGWHKVEIGRTSVPAGRDSQAGFTLQSAEPVVVAELSSEKRFSGPKLLHDHKVVSGLSVIVGERADPYGVLGVHARSRREFTAHEVNFVQAAANVLANSLRAEHAVRRQSTLLHELQHRVKNTLAIVQSLATQTLRRGSAPEIAAEAFKHRLQALARAHNLLTEHDWEDVRFDHLLESELTSSLSPGPGRVRVQGPPSAWLPPLAVIPVAMALHELATNAVKHGALSTPGGRVALSWDLIETKHAGRLQLNWVETGGPTIALPVRHGFGLQLIQRGLEHNLKARVKLDFARSGLTCHIDLPLTGV